MAHSHQKTVTNRAPSPNKSQPACKYLEAELCVLVTLKGPQRLLGVVVPEHYLAIHAARQHILVVRGEGSERDGWASCGEEAYQAVSGVAGPDSSGTEVGEGGGGR